MPAVTRAPSARWSAVRERYETAITEAISRIAVEDPANMKVAVVATRAGISRPTFYKRFPTIESAVVYTYGRRFTELSQRVNDRLAEGDQSSSGRERLLRLFETVFDIFLDDPDLLRFLSYVDFSFLHRELTQEDKATFDRFGAEGQAGLEAIFRAGQQDGSITCSLPLRQTVLAIGTSLMGAAQRLQVQNEWTTESHDDARNIYAALLSFWDRTLAPEPVLSDVQLQQR